MTIFYNSIFVLFFAVAYLTAQLSELSESVQNNSPLNTKTQAAVTIELKEVYTGVKFSSPLLLTHAGDNSGRVFVVQQGGLILVLPADLESSDAKTFLDLTSIVTDGGERGLLGLAFHPEYSGNGKFYVNYTAGSNTYIVEYLVSGDPDVADPQSARVILTQDQPAANHNGGHLVFGKDGYLYIGFGDGGLSSNGQKMENLLGTILRIDIDQKQAGLEYNIPEDNPFFGIDDGTREEIWAYGLRNPWRFSFDRETGTLWCGDVGQVSWEEVDIIEKGKNYGWNIMEGFNCYSPSSGCDTSGLALPIVEYDRNEGKSITGGYVYRGTEIANWQGTYIYGDYLSKKIWGLVYQNGEIIKNDLIATSIPSISSFGEDEKGELYVVGHWDASIYKIVQDPTAIEDDRNIIPTFFDTRAYPNPFNPVTTIEYQIPGNAFVSIQLFDLNGRLISSLVNEKKNAGTHFERLDFSKYANRQLSSGLYFYKITAQAETTLHQKTGKIVLLK